MSGLSLRYHEAKCEVSLIVDDLQITPGFSVVESVFDAVAFHPMQHFIQNNYNTVTAFKKTAEKGS